MTEQNDPGAYNQQELEQAAEELQEMTPEDLLDMRRYLTNLENQAVLPEAGASATAHILGFDGLEILFTVRHPDPREVYRNMYYVLHPLIQGGHCRPIKRYTSEYDVPGQPDKIPVADQPPQPEPQPVQTTQPPQPTPVPVSTDVLSFPADRLEVSSMRGGTPYWRVKGGQFSRYGVAIWPEILEAAGIIDPDPTVVHKLTGWTAEYILNDKGNPKKVVNLIAPH